MADTRIWVFDTDLGLCAFLRAPNGRMLLVDCGIKMYFSPARYLSRFEMPSPESRLDALVVSHPHADHLLDFENVVSLLRPRAVIRQQYDWDEVEASQERPAGVYRNYLGEIPWRERIQMYGRWQAGFEIDPPPVDWGGVEVRTFCVPVERSQELGPHWLNNSSIVVVISAGDFKLVLPGDLEVEGWRELLGRGDFRAAVSHPSVLVASHHGHETGYAPEIFEAMGLPAFNLTVGHNRDARWNLVYRTEATGSGVTYEGVMRHGFTNWRDGSLLLRVSETGEWRFTFQRLLPTEPLPSRMTNLGRLGQERGKS